VLSIALEMAAFSDLAVGPVLAREWTFHIPGICAGYESLTCLFISVGYNRSASPCFRLLHKSGTGYAVVRVLYRLNSPLKCRDWGYE